MAGRPKGIAKTGGRKKGSVNKLTSDVKQMILNALDKVGGEDYLQGQALTNPNAFMTLVGKVLPMTLAGDPDKPLHISPPVIQIVRDSDQANKVN